MNLHLLSRSLRVTLPVAGLIGLAACGDDTTPSDTSDTSSDTSTVDVQDTIAPDTTEDTSTPSDVPDSTTDTTTDTADDTAQDTTEDTAQDTTPGDVVTPTVAKTVLVAWNGLSLNSPDRGAINVTTSTGTAFGPFTTWKNGTNVNPVAFGSTANLIGDVDGDGLADLVAWYGLSLNSPDRGAINVFLSTGSAFSDFTTWKTGTIPAPVVFGTTANLIGDVDGDGDADLVAWNGLSLNSPDRGSINVMISTGSAFSDSTTWKTGTNPAPVVFGSTTNLIGDVDGDGRDDLVAWNGLSLNSPDRGSINVMLSTGSAFGDASTWKTGTMPAPVVFGSTASLIGDVDGDGKADLIAWNGLSLNSPDRGSIQVMLSTGSSFADATTWFTGTFETPTVFGSTANLIADVNGDGRADLIAWNGLSTNSPARGSISVFLSTGTGFSPATTWFSGTNEAGTLFGSTANLAGPSAE